MAPAREKDIQESPPVKMKEEGNKNKAREAKLILAADVASLLLVCAGVLAILFLMPEVAVR
eukprot:768134-Hanusia_phi.AAC.1